MKTFAVAALAILGAVPALAQDQSSCKAYFQVVRADAGMPGLTVGLDAAQKRWWDDKGQKKYPGLCLNGAVMANDKPRYLVIWSKSRTVGQSSISANEVYGQTSANLQATAPTTKIYQKRWDQAAVTIINVQYDGNLMLPPVYFETDDHVWILAPSSRKVIEAAAKYLSQEMVFDPKGDAK